MQLLDLADDVLKDICSRLFGRHALSLAITCKRMHDLAIDYVGSVIRARDIRHLQTLLRYVLDGDHLRRARYVDSIIIYWNTIEHSIRYNTSLLGRGQDDRDDDEWEDIEDEQDVELEDEEEDESRFTLGVVADQIAGLLERIQNLRRFSLDYFNTFLRNHERLASTLGTLRQLRHVEAENVSDYSIQFIGGTGWNLHTLALNYDRPDSERGHRAHISTDTRTLPVLLHTLSCLPNLHTLKILHFPFTQSSDGSNSEISESLHHRSLRELFVWGAPEWRLELVFDFVTHFPNIALVDIAFADSLFWHGVGIVICHEATGQAAPELQSPLPTRWRPLRTLVLCSLEAAHHAKSRLSRAYHLRIKQRISLLEGGYRRTEAPSRVAGFLEVLRRVSPARTQLWLELGPSFPSSRFWSQVPAVAPHLRYLELAVSFPGNDPKCASWLGSIPDVLRDLPLILLHIHLPRFRLVNQYRDGWELKVDQARSCRLYDAALAALQPLPARFANVMPTLRLIGISDEGPNWDCRRAALRAKRHANKLSQSSQTRGGQDYANGGEHGQERARYYASSDTETTLDGSIVDDRWTNLLRHTPPDQEFFDERDDYVCEGGWYQIQLATSQWWRTCGADGERRVEELSVEQGQSILRLLSDKSLRWTEQMDELLPPLYT